MSDVNVINRPVRVTVKAVSKPIRVNAATAQRVRSDARKTVITPKDPVCDVIVKDPVSTVVDTGGKQGLPGPPGPPGPAGGSIIPFLVGSTIHGLRAVRASDGRLYHPDLEQVEHAKETFGVSLQSASAGEVNVQLAGELTEPSWSWEPGYVYCGQDGHLVQPAPVDGWLLSIGRAISATTIIIDIDTPIVRA